MYILSVFVFSDVCRFICWLSCHTHINLLRFGGNFKICIGKYEKQFIIYLVETIILIVFIVSVTL